MAQENSFDIVSKVDMQEVRNAIDQALKEVRQRFDLKDSHSEINLAEADKEILLASDGEYHLEAVKEILGQKLVKRGVSLKNLTYERWKRRPARAFARRSSCRSASRLKRPRRSFVWSKTQKRKPRRASKAIQSEYPVKTATSFKGLSLCCGARIWEWICSSRTTAPIEHLRCGGLSLQQPSNRSSRTVG